MLPKSPPPLAGAPSSPTLTSSVVPARAGPATPAPRASPARSAHPAAARAGDGRPVPLAAGGKGNRMVSIVLAGSPVRLVMASPVRRLPLRGRRLDADYPSRADGVLRLSPQNRGPAGEPGEPSWAPAGCSGRARRCVG